MSAEKIRHALSKLDPNQDVHWTKEGEPAVNFVNIFSGTKSQREDINRAWPGFARGNALERVKAGYTEPVDQTEAQQEGGSVPPLPGAPAPSGEVPNTTITSDPANPPAVQDNPPNPDPVRAQDAEGAPAGETIPPDLPPEAQDQDLKAEPVGEVKESVVNTDVAADSNDELAQLEDELRRIDDYVDQANARKRELQARMDVIYESRNSAAAAFHETNANYLESQKRLLEERAQRHRAIQDAGLTPEKLMQLLPTVSPIDKALATKKRS